jgi:hypothetical protein
MIWLLPHPLLPLPSISSAGDTQLRLRKRDNLLTGERGGGGAISYDGEKARSFINKSILSLQPLYLPSPLRYYLPFPGSTLSNRCHSLLSRWKEWSNFYWKNE